MHQLADPGQLEEWQQFHLSKQRDSSYHTCRAVESGGKCAARGASCLVTICVRRTPCSAAVGLLPGMAALPSMSSSQ